MPHWTTELKQPYVQDGGNWEKSPAMRHWEDLAWRVQDDTENVLLARARWLRETTGAKNLTHGRRCRPELRGQWPARP